MGTTIRPEVSEKNPYWLERHRYYELKHFCLQYPTWHKAHLAIKDFSQRPADLTMAFAKTNTVSDPVGKCVEQMSVYSERMALVEGVVRDATGELADYILLSVTKGCSYEYLKMRHEIPCCRDKYYEAYRRFFWLLNNARN